MNDQAQNLRELVQRRQHCAQVIAVTSGKGGVGKTNTSVNLAIALAARGRRVVLMDADLGLANVEVLLGLTSFYNLEHVIEGEKSLREVCIQGPGGIRVIPGSSGLARVADLTTQMRDRLIEELRSLQQESDFIIIDTMAGIGRNAVAFSAAADEVLLVATPEPSSIVDAYAMLKTLIGVRPELMVRLLVNQATNQAQAQAVSVKLSRVAQQYLDRTLPCAGWLPRDVHVSQAVMQSRPFMTAYPSAPISQQMQLLAGRFTTEEQGAERGSRDGFLRRIAQSFGLASNG